MTFVPSRSTGEVSHQPADALEVVATHLRTHWLWAGGAVMVHRLKPFPSTAGLATRIGFDAAGRSQ